MKAKESGSTLVLSMIIIVVLAMCVAGALDYTTQTYRDTQRTDARSQAVTAATGALDLAFVQWTAACRKLENLTLTSDQITQGRAIPGKHPAIPRSQAARPASEVSWPGYRVP
jgi:type II secretory pathway component PulK